MFEMTALEIRARSSANARRMGFPVNRELPMLDAEMAKRHPDEIAARALALHVVVACSYGFDRDKAIAWLENERLLSALSDTERKFIFEGLGSPERFQDQVEGLYAFAWILRLSEEIDFSTRCDDNLVNLFPNLRIGGSASQFLVNANLRNRREILEACDLAYCLHWGIRQLLLENKPLPQGFEEYIIAERRRTLEWAIFKEDWDEISLDT